MRIALLRYVACTGLMLAACDERPRVLAPDFAIDFRCKAVPNAETVEGFFRRHGFRAFDEEGPREKRGHHFFVLEVDGYDPRRRMFEVIGLRQPASYGSGVLYRLTITSPPPTHQDGRIEKDARNFAERTLHCRVTSASHFENGSESTELFRSVFQQVLRRSRI